MRIKTVSQPQTVFFRTGIPPLKSAAGEEAPFSPGGARGFSLFCSAGGGSLPGSDAAEVCVDPHSHHRGMGQIANHAASAPASPPHQIYPSSQPRGHVIYYPLKANEGPCKWVNTKMSWSWRMTGKSTSWSEPTCRSRGFVESSPHLTAKCPQPGPPASPQPHCAGPDAPRHRWL